MPHWHLVVGSRLGVERYHGNDYISALRLLATKEHPYVIRLKQVACRNAHRFQPIPDSEEQMPMSYRSAEWKDFGRQDFISGKAARHPDNVYYMEGYREAEQADARDKGLTEDDPTSGLDDELLAEMDTEA